MDKLKGSILSTVAESSLRTKLGAFQGQWKVMLGYVKTATALSKANSTIKEFMEEVEKAEVLISTMKGTFLERAAAMTPGVYPKDDFLQFAFYTTEYLYMSAMQHILLLGYFQGADYKWAAYEERTVDWAIDYLDLFHQYGCHAKAWRQGFVSTVACATQCHEDCMVRDRDPEMGPEWAVSCTGFGIRYQSAYSFYDTYIDDQTPSAQAVPSRQTGSINEDTGSFSNSWPFSSTAASDGSEIKQARETYLANLGLALADFYFGMGDQFFSVLKGFDATKFGKEFKPVNRICPAADPKDLYDAATRDAAVESSNLKLLPGYTSASGPAAFIPHVTTMFCLLLPSLAL